MTSSDPSAILQVLMQHADVPSLRALSKRAGVSLWQVRQLQRGNLRQMRLAGLMALSNGLGLSLVELFQAFAVLEGDAVAQADARSLPIGIAQPELEEGSNPQQEMLYQMFQRHSLDIVESLLVQLPTVLYGIVQNPQLPAKNLVPLLASLDRLWQQWGLEQIATVGAEVPYDPHQHQMLEGVAQPGDLVKIRYAGWRWQGKLLHRAQVSALLSGS